MTISNGTWDLGVLKTEDDRRSAGRPEAATLTLILNGEDAVSAAATATIANVASYTVCVGSDGSTLPHSNQADCEGDAATTNDWHTAVCVNTANGEIDSTITLEATCNSTTDRAWTENVCASSDGSVRANRTENGVRRLVPGHGVRLQRWQTTRPPSPRKREPAVVEKAHRPYGAQSTPAPASP